MIEYLQLPCFKKKLVDLQSRRDQWLYFLKHLEHFDIIPQLFMTDSTFKKALSVAEVAKLSPEDAKRYQINRTEYIEIKGVSDAAYADGRHDAEEEFTVLLEKERSEKEKERSEKEKERQKNEMLISVLKNLIASGVPKESVAQANNMTITELEKLLEI